MHNRVRNLRSKGIFTGGPFAGYYEVMTAGNVWLPVSAVGPVFAVLSGADLASSSLPAATGRFTFHPR